MSIKQLTSRNVLFNPLHFDMGIYILNTVLKTSFYLHVYGADMENLFSYQENLSLVIRFSALMTFIV